MPPNSPKPASSNDKSRPRVSPLTNMRSILNGLTRGLDLSLLDAGFGELGGVPISFYPTTQALGLVMPSNSPAVKSLWLAALALKNPGLIKTGREEARAAFSFVPAMIAAGDP